MMEDEIVTKPRWLDRQHFLDLVGAIHFIPGPNSTELAIALGGLRAGFSGLVTAGVCFITPAVLIILAAGLGVRALRQHADRATSDAWNRRGGFGDRHGGALEICPDRIKKHIHDLHCGWGDDRTADNDALAAGHYAGSSDSGDGSTCWIDETFFAVEIEKRHRRLLLMPPEMWRMAASFLKIGATLYGSGYVLISYLQSSFVDQHGWLNRQQAYELADGNCISTCWRFKPAMLIDETALQITDQHVSTSVQRRADFQK